MSSTIVETIGPLRIPSHSAQIAAETRAPERMQQHIQDILLNPTIRSLQNGIHEVSALTEKFKGKADYSLIRSECIMLTLYVVPFARAIGHLLSVKESPNKNGQLSMVQESAGHQHALFKERAQLAWARTWAEEGRDPANIRRGFHWRFQCILDMIEVLEKIPELNLQAG